MTEGIVEIRIRIKVDVMDNGDVSAEDEKKIDDLVCDMIDEVSDTGFFTTSDEWEVIDDEE